MAAVNEKPAPPKPGTGNVAAVGQEARYRTFLHARIALVGLVVFLLVGAFVSGMLWSDIAHEDRRLQQEEAIEVSERLVTENRELKTRVDLLTENLARAERQIQVDKVSYEELTNALDVSEAYTNELRDELRFYQSIITPGDSEKGLRIHDLSLSETPDKGRFRYRLVLVQTLGRDREVTGDINLVLEGSANGALSKHQLKDLGASIPGMSFRYFQIFEGEFMTPEAFLPGRLLVQIRPKKTDGGPQPFEQWFPWTLTSRG